MQKPRLTNRQQLAQLPELELTAGDVARVPGGGEREAVPHRG